MAQIESANYPMHAAVPLSAEQACEAITVLSRDMPDSNRLINQIRSNPTTSWDFEAVGAASDSRKAHNERMRRMLNLGPNEIPNNWSLSKYCTNMNAAVKGTEENKILRQSLGLAAHPESKSNGRNAVNDRKRLGKGKAHRNGNRNDNPVQNESIQATDDIDRLMNGSQATDDIDRLMNGSQATDDIDRLMNGSRAPQSFRPACDTPCKNGSTCRFGAKCWYKHDEPTIAHSMNVIPGPAASSIEIPAPAKPARRVEATAPVAQPSASLAPASASVDGINLAKLESKIDAQNEQIAAQNALIAELQLANAKTNEIIRKMVEMLTQQKKTIDAHAKNFEELTPMVMVDHCYLDVLTRDFKKRTGQSAVPIIAQLATSSAAQAATSSAAQAATSSAAQAATPSDAPAAQASASSSAADDAFSGLSASARAVFHR